MITEIKIFTYLVTFIVVPETYATILKLITVKLFDGSIYLTKITNGNSNNNNININKNSDNLNNNNINRNSNIINGNKNNDGKINNT